MRSLVKKARVAQLVAVTTLLGITYAYPHVGAASVPMGMPRDMVLTASHMPMLTATAADSFIPKADPIASSGWTATASDEARSHPASNAIDGNNATFWESSDYAQARALPHSITIDMHASKYVVWPDLPAAPGRQPSRETLASISISVSRNGKQLERACRYRDVGG